MRVNTYVGNNFIIININFVKARQTEMLFPQLLINLISFCVRDNYESIKGVKAVLFPNFRSGAPALPPPYEYVFLML